MICAELSFLNKALKTIAMLPCTQYPATAFCGRTAERLNHIYALHNPTPTLLYKDLEVLRGRSRVVNNINITLSDFPSYVTTADAGSALIID